MVAIIVSVFGLYTCLSPTKAESPQAGPDCLSSAPPTGLLFSGLKFLYLLSRKLWFFQGWLIGCQDSNEQSWVFFFFFFPVNLEMGDTPITEASW